LPPHRDFSKKVIAAVGIVAPASRLTDERIEKNKIVAMLIDAGNAISAKMGCSGPSRRSNASLHQGVPSPLLTPSIQLCYYRSNDERTKMGPSP
jgi:hypothetical protein